MGSKGWGCRLLDLSGLGPKAPELGREGRGRGIGKGLADGAKFLPKEEVMVSPDWGRDTTSCGPGEETGRLVRGGVCVIE